MDATALATNGEGFSQTVDPTNFGGGFHTASLPPTVSVNVGG